ncbi:hypothetical protein GGC65_001303 [Sphingopyxis sp. OAS728]|uniref:hypothetical protein n=1 Tax=Sphingopyxis sp. OAS728 TaxID=2663823 RepID=UPI00178BB9DE|nr:hypothetical protein [Sphingopyxis sp. OAS728]MBE1526847.1 hypothetical protein [Sphingopyxis sp. OAS728]
MNQDVLEAIEELKRAFPSSAVTVVEDGQGGARVIIETLDIGERYCPRFTWMGGHITALYPNADIYPVFVGGDVRRSDGRAFEVPITAGMTFEGRPALQVSRMNNQMHLARQTALAKFLKILHFLETVQ